jgi:hypothetical protein
MFFMLRIRFHIVCSFRLGVDCGQPALPGINAETDDVDTKFSSTRNYTCNHGYVSDGHSGEISCQVSGRWTSLALTCVGNILLYILKHSFVQSTCIFMYINRPIVYNVNHTTLRTSCLPRWRLIWNRNNLRESPRTQ